MELYALKSGAQYLKKIETGVKKVELAKASVYQNLEEVLILKNIAEQAGYQDFHCIKLILSETEIPIPTKEKP